MTQSDTPWWGVTSSSLQTEGVTPAADWSRWERDKRVPASGDGNGIATNHGDDFLLLASLGLTHVRLTLEWARLEPEQGRIDADAFDRYQDIIVSARQAGLNVIATLVHTTLPGWFSEDTNGFRDARRRELDWARHVDRCAERFEGLIDMWVPIDDPIGWAIRGHLIGNRPPGRRDAETAAAAIEGAMLANHIAWNLLRTGTTPVMGVFGAPTIFGHGPETGPQRQLWHDLIFGTWMSAIRDGELLIPGLTPRERPELAGAFDVIGLSHDHPIAVDHAGGMHAYPADDRRSDTGFTPIPNELGELLSYMSTELPGRPLAIAAHGVATNDDEWRERILQETHDIVMDAAADGLPVIGYLHDTGIDGYEGPYGFDTQKGLIGRNRELKDSARWLQSRLT
jgi:beta-glucosidase